MSQIIPLRSSFAIGGATAPHAWAWHFLEAEYAHRWQSNPSRFQAAHVTYDARSAARMCARGTHAHMEKKYNESLYSFSMCGRVPRAHLHKRPWSTASRANHFTQTFEGIYPRCPINNPLRKYTLFWWAINKWDLGPRLTPPVEIDQWRGFTLEPDLLWDRGDLLYSSPCAHMARL